VHAAVDRTRRRDVERNHSATHLLHWALRKHLGDHVRQQGSLVEPGRLRFDFSHHGPIDPATLALIERDVYDQVLENALVDTQEMAYPDALARGAMAFFADKYGDRVRVVQMGPSIELCGGTHVRSTGQLGLFRLAGQGGVAAGVRRIEAITGPEAYASVQREEGLLQQVATTLKANKDHVARKLDQLLEEREKLKARLDDAVKRGIGADQSATTTQLEIGGAKVVVEEVDQIEREAAGAKADAFRAAGSGVYLLLDRSGSIHVAVTDDLVRTGRKAGDLVGRLAAISGGKGGGRPGFASAGAGDAAKLPAVREAAPAIIEAWLAGR
jgi:alanyl-tRNA synthetase